MKDIVSNCVGILVNENRIRGTGSIRENHITRVYVSQDFQGKGYGSYIIQCLEDEIDSKYNTVYLDASLPASCLYEHRGYKTTKHDKYIVKNNAILVYEIMKKQLSQ